MTVPPRVRGLLRDVAPWIVATVGLLLCLRIVWPAQVAASLDDRSRAETLRKVVPDRAILQAKVDALQADSARIAQRILLAKSRQILESDPAATLASQVVPLLGSTGWKLDRVKADASNGFAVLDLGASTSFEEALRGLRSIDDLPLAVRIRRLALRPSPAGKLNVDLQIAVPAPGGTP